MCKAPGFQVAAKSLKCVRHDQHAAQLPAPQVEYAYGHRLFLSRLHPKFEVVTAGSGTPGASNSSTGAVTFALGVNRELSSGGQAGRKTDNDLITLFPQLFDACAVTVPVTAVEG